jgi:hypothetical protein
VPGGNSKWIRSDGDYYEGEIKGSNKPDGGWHFVLEGQGIYTLADGEQYSGEYKDGLKNGQGTLSCLNGDIYIGEFLDDEFN